MQRNIDESTRPLLLSSVMEEKAFGVTLAEGRGWRLQQRIPPIRGWERAGGGSRATAHSCLCVCVTGFLSPEVCWCSGTRCPIPLGFVGGPCSVGHHPGRPAHLVVTAGSLSPCCLHIRFHLVLLFYLSCCFTSLSFLFFLPLRVWFGRSDLSLQSRLAA